MELVYNTQEEVNERQYSALRKDADGIIAFRSEGEKFYIKLLWPKFRKMVAGILEKHKTP